MTGTSTGVSLLISGYGYDWSGSLSFTGLNSSYSVTHTGPGDGVGAYVLITLLNNGTVQVSRRGQGTTWDLLIIDTGNWYTRAVNDPPFAEGPFFEVRCTVISGSGTAIPSNWSTIINNNNSITVARNPTGTNSGIIRVEIREISNSSNYTFMDFNLSATVTT